MACVLLILLLGRHYPMEWGLPQKLHQPGAMPPIPYSTLYYFGGRPIGRTGTPVELGPSAAGVLAGLLPWRGAATVPLPACVALEPPAPAATAVPKNIAADLPGLYGAPWVASVNGDLIAALRVTVPRNPGWQASGPVLQFYRPGRMQPAFSATVPVSVTRGSKALLYRMFVQGPIDCIDLVIPNGAGSGTAHLYYPFRGRIYVAESVFSVQR